MKTLWSKPQSPEPQSPFWWLRWIPTLVISALVVYFLYIFGSVALVPVLASFALAYLLDPIVWQFEKRGLSRMWSSIISILLVTLLITAFIAYVIPDLWAESTRAGTKIAQNFTPENAAQQREVLRNIRPRSKKWRAIKSNNF